MYRCLPTDRLLIAGSTAWLIVFLLVPALHSAPAAFAATVICIAANAVISFRTLTRQRRVLVGLNCLQIALFGTLNYQLYCAFGVGHYQCDREPRFYDWIEFTAAHIARAADFLDALDEYGIPIQTITHHSRAAGMLLVCMHLTVDVFLIGLVIRWLSRHWQDTHETRLARGRREFGWLLASLGLFLAFVIFQQLEPIDWFLWPMDNLLRLLDVGDMFQVFGWRLHGVEANYWTRGASLLFRLIAGLWMARLVCWVRLKVLRTWGLSVDELTKMLDDEDQQLRQAAADGLRRTGEVAGSAVPALIAALHDIDKDVRMQAARALGEIGPPAADAVGDLIDAAWLGRRDLRLAAIEALGRVGANDRATVYSLVSLFKVGDEATRRTIRIALEALAPEIIAFLPKQKPRVKIRRRFGRRSRAK